MVICPWCGTNYETFRSNCKNCGGPLQAAVEAPAARLASAGSTMVESGITGDGLVPPPPAPRSISNNYTIKLMLMDAWSIVGLVLGIVGGVFTLVGLVLTIFVVTAMVGIPFASIGLPMLLTGGGFLYWRYNEKQKVVDVLKYGQAVRGEVTGTHEDPTVRVNHRHPWVIEYQFRANGQVYNGSISTLRGLASQLQPGKATYVLYQPDAPERNALYPHL